MKVLIFPFINRGHNGLQPASGYSTYFLELTRALRAQNIEAHILVLSVSSPGSQQNHGLDQCIHLKLPSAFFLNNITMYSVLPQKYLTSYLTRLNSMHKFDIFHTMAPWNYFLDKEGPCVVTTFGIMPSVAEVARTYWKLYSGPKKAGILLNSLIYSFENASFKRADQIVVTCHCKVGSLASLFGSEKTVYIPPGVQLETEGPTRHARISSRYLSLKQELLSKRRRKLLYVCNDLTRRRNGVFQLFQALAAARKRDTLLHLTIVGANGSILQPFVRKLGIESYVLDMGLLTRQELDDLYGQVDAFVFPGLVDDCPYAVLEAMAHGLPIICSNLPTFHERVSTKNGFLIPPGRVDLLANAILTLFEDERLLNSMGQESRKAAETKYSWRHVASEVSKLYKTLLS